MPDDATPPSLGDEIRTIASMVDQDETDRDQQLRGIAKGLDEALKLVDDLRRDLETLRDELDDIAP